MAKSPKATAPKTADAETKPDAATPETPKEPKVPLSKMRGPRGTQETAKIKLLSPGNPKRPSSKAHRVFSHYVDGMTVGQFCDAVDATEDKGEATPNLVYDAAHRFIEIEGYTPGAFFEPKPKAPKAEKPAKAPKAAPKTEEQVAEQKAAVEAEKQTEVIE